MFIRPNTWSPIRSLSRSRIAPIDIQRARTSFASSHGSKLSTRLVINEASPSATTKYALPLAFLAIEQSPSSGKPVKGMASEPLRAWSHDWVQRFNQQGYSTATILLSGSISPEVLPITEQLLILEREIKTHLSGGANSFFPPLLFAKGGLECLLAQTYVSSNPLSGLVLISPHGSDSVPAFDFEPRFPIVIMSSKSQAAKGHLSKHWLLREHADEVDFLIVDGDELDMETEVGFERLKDWMDGNGL